MAKIGMTGGTGPESTADYYQRLIKLYQQKLMTEAMGQLENLAADLSFTCCKKRGAL